MTRFIALAISLVAMTTPTPAAAQLSLHEVWQLRRDITRREASELAPQVFAGLSEPGVMEHIRQRQCDFASDCVHYRRLMNAANKLLRAAHRDRLTRIRRRIEHFLPPPGNDPVSVSVYTRYAWIWELATPVVVNLPPEARGPLPHGIVGRASFSGVYWRVGRTEVRGGETGVVTRVFRDPRSVDTVTDVFVRHRGEWWVDQSLFMRADIRPPYSPPPDPLYRTPPPIGCTLQSAH